MNTQYASGLTLLQRFEIVSGWIACEEFLGSKEAYIEATAKRIGLREETVRLVMAEGIVV